MIQLHKTLLDRREKDKLRKRSYRKIKREAKLAKLKPELDKMTRANAIVKILGAKI